MDFYNYYHSIDQRCKEGKAATRFEMFMRIFIPVILLIGFIGFIWYKLIIYFWF